jgi:hypothetical protein
MRTKGDKCLLCLENLSNKENSHIIPKFISKSILGEGPVKRAFLIGTDRAHKPPEFSQDSPKEDYLLCESCEEYFSILETYMATRLHNRIWDIRYQRQFITNISEGGICWKNCNEINPTIFRLFIYSIIWRCSVSSTEAFKTFKLEPKEEISLRSALHKFKQTKQKDLLNKITVEFGEILIPFVFFTSDNFVDRTANFILANPAVRNPYQIVLNEYMLLFSFELNEKQKVFDFLNNLDNSATKVGFFPIELWNGLRQDSINFVAKIALDNIRKNNQTPYFKDLICEFLQRIGQPLKGVWR